MKMIGKRTTRTITPGGFTPTKRQGKRLHCCHGYRRIREAANRTLLVYQRSVRVQ